PQARIWIYGAYLPNDVNAFHTPDEGFLIGGWADDLAHKIQAARVMLAPLRFGAGIKGKLALAMQCGTPNVTTGIGAEGMSGDLPWSGYISATAEEFAEKAVDLYQKREEWDIAQQQGLQIINICYNKAKLRRGFSEVLEQLSCGLNAYRQKNFIGQMLWHHTLTSTKYMGKWIEEKHRKD
ncbi:MAG: glycosyltransferase family 4 protein, partial [Bacteroidota bacterium]